MSKDNTKIEKLLNKIYNEVDLKDVFEFIQPFILNAYALLRHDEELKEEGKIDQVLFKDLEQKVILQNILYRDFPGIIDIYTKTPLEYRNEKILRDNKTYRELLIENVEILCKRIKKIENDAYSQFDVSMKVSNTLIKDKYADNDYLQLSKDTLQAQSNIQYKVEDKFNWSKLKETTEKIFVKENKFKKDDNKKIVVTENQIQYKIKDKHRHFMNGIYNGYNNSKKYFSKLSMNSVDRFNTMIYDIKRTHTSEKIALTFFATVIGGLVYFCFNVTSSYIQSSAAKQIEEINELSKSNGELREFSIKAIDKFIKENDLVIEVTPNEKFNYIHRDVSKNQCIHSIKYLQKEHKYNYDKIDYYINDKLITTTENLKDSIIEEVCELPKNRIGIAIPIMNK